MLSVRNNPSEEENQRDARGYGSVSEEKILRQNVHVAGLLKNENSVAEGEQKTSSQTCENDMLKMRRSHNKDACPSYGRKSNEQLSRELEDTLFILSQETSSASVEGCPSATLLSALYEVCKEKGNVSETLSTLEEIWRSINDKEKGKWNPEQLYYCTKRIMKYSLFPMANGIPSGRVGLLRGAGNAICPEIAAEFVMAYMEAANEL